MKVEIVNAGDPLVLLGRIPASSECRVLREHEAGIYLLRYGIELLGFDMGEVAYKTTGKPYFTNSDLPYFNISHSKGLVICSISRQEVGCDIELIQRIPRILNTELRKIINANTRPLFSHEEKETLLWTIYEAVAKCMGTGIPINQDKIDCKEWNIINRTINEKYIISVVTKCV